jgi:hypothetical protein
MYVKDELRNYFREGYSAYQDSEFFSETIECPYDEDEFPEKYEAWNKGWEIASEDS